MNKKSKFFILFLMFFIVLIFVETIYLYKCQTISMKDLQDKQALLKITGLPDLAISTEAMYIRHRTLSETFSILKESPELREYFPSTFVYSHSHILNNTSSKVLNEK